jgi:hypothetical protein
MKTITEFFLMTLIIGALTVIYSCSDDPAVTLNTEKDILSFTVTGLTGPATINASSMTVVAEVECGTDLTNLTPTFTISEGATASPASGNAVDFSSQVNIMVTAEDGTTANWTITISEACANATDILTFSFPEETGAADIDNDAHTIDIEVENGTNLTALTSTFTLSAGATSVPASGTEGDYSSPVTITVTAEDGTTTQEWTVNVTESGPVLSDATDIITFTLPEQMGNAEIDDVNHTISIEVENGTDLTKLTPIFSLSEGATSEPASETEGDYSSPVTISVTAEDGTTVQDWIITVTEAEPELSDAADILIFLIPEQTSLAEIDFTNHAISIEVVNGTDLTSLTPTFLISIGASSNPESGTTGDYSGPVTITVTAEDGTTTQDWAVNVSEAAAGLSDKTDILSFEMPEQITDPLIEGDKHQVTVSVPTGTNLSILTPTFTLSPGATSVPVSGTTGDYSDTVTITVTAEDGMTTQDWTIQVLTVDDLDPALFCDANLCADQPGLQQECQDFLAVCLATNPQTDYDECLIAALSICK